MVCWSTQVVEPACELPRVLHQGTWVYGKRHGQGSYKYHDGGMYDGEWVDDKVRFIAACKQLQPGAAHVVGTAAHSLIAPRRAAGAARVDPRSGHPRVRDRQQGEPRKRYLRPASPVQPGVSCVPWLNLTCVPSPPLRVAVCW